MICQENNENSANPFTCILINMTIMVQCKLLLDWCKLLLMWVCSWQSTTGVPPGGQPRSQGYISILQVYIKY